MRRGYGVVGARGRREFRARPIGLIRSPWTAARGTPIQPVFAEGARGQVVIDPEHAEALTDIEGFDRIWLIYWLDRAGRYRPLVTPYLDDRPHGVLATRSPARPVPIGLSVVRLVERRGCTLEVADLDVLDRTPLLDLKPYVPCFDAWAGRAGWVDSAPAPTRRDDGRFEGDAGGLKKRNRPRLSRRPRSGAPQRRFRSNRSFRPPL